MIRHFLKLSDYSKEELRYILDRARELKAKKAAGDFYEPFRGKTLTMVFEKPSTRTRVSFEAGFYQLGGNVIHMNTADSQLGRNESIADTSRVISRMCDCIMMRTFGQSKLEEMAINSAVPVINGLTNEYHPCQIMADIMTFEEHRGSIEGQTVAWIGDANNMAYTWIEAAQKLGFTVHFSSPSEYPLSPERVVCGEHLKVFADPKEAVKGAALVTTDVWTSMGYEAQNCERQRIFAPWQVNEALMQEAREDALFMHCLPAHRGEEVASGVIDGVQSVVWDEAENRLHVQKGIMEYCLLGKIDDKYQV